MDFDALLDLAADNLGIIDSEEKEKLRHYVSAAIEMCRAQTGQTDYDSSEAARQWVIFAAAQMYADRFGELGNKESSAMAQMMNNLRFTLRMQNLKKVAENESNDSQD